MFRFSAIAFIVSYAYLIQAQTLTSFRFDAVAQYAGAQLPGTNSLEFTYMFSNTGTLPLRVSGVDPCSRCMVVASSKSPVRPGGRGFVAIKYQLPAQPGRFMESFNVYFNNAIHNPVKLSFSGELLPPAKDKTQVFAYCHDDLCLKDEWLDMGRILHTKHLTKDFDVLNGGNTPLDLVGPPFHAFLMAELFPSPLLPGEKGTLKVTYRAAQRPGFGPLFDTLNLYSRSDEMNPIKVLLKTHVEEDFSKLKPDQLSVSPQVSFIETRQEVGAIKRGDEITCRFELRNKGKRQLIVRSLHSSSQMLQVEMPQRVLRQSQSGEIIVHLTASAPKGPFLETITITCNDPKRPEANLYVQGVIVD